VTDPRAGRRLPTDALVTILQPWDEIAEPLHRRLVHVLDPSPEWDTLWVGAGAARSALWWAKRVGGHVAALDPRPAAVEWAERAARSSGLSRRVTLQAGWADDLPHETDVFDLIVLSLLLQPRVDAGEAMRQAARVVRPRRPVAALVPTWSGTPPEGPAADLARLGIHPRFLVEWKATLRDAGFVELTAEAIAPDGRWLASGWIGVLLRAWRAAGVRAVSGMLAREIRALRALVRTRALGASLITGVRWIDA